MDFDKLTEEQKAKIAGKTPKEILEMAKEDGYELSEEEMEGISGGVNWGPYYYCPTCGQGVAFAKRGDRVTCSKCHVSFTVE